MAIARVRRAFVARSVFVVVALTLAQFFLGELAGRAAPRHDEHRSTGRRVTARHAVPRLTLSPVVCASALVGSEAPLSTAAGPALLETATDPATSGPGDGEVATSDASPVELAAEEASPPSPPPVSPEVAARKARRMARTLVVRGRIGAPDDEGNVVPVAGVAVRLVALGQGDGPERSDEEAALLAGRVADADRRLVARANSRQTHVKEVGSVETGDDGRFAFTVERERLPVDTQLWLTASTTIEGERWHIRSEAQNVRSQLRAIDDDEWNLGVLELERSTALHYRIAVSSAGRPVAGATVSTEDAEVSAVTGSSGQCELELSRSSSLVVRAGGFAPRGLTLDVESRATCLQVELAPSRAVVVEVVDEHGRALPGVAVHASGNSAGLVASSRTGETGQATLEGLAPGAEYSLTACPDGGALLSASSEVVAGSEKGPVRIVLGRAGSIALTIAFEDDVPASAREPLVELSVQKLDGDAWQYAQSVTAQTLKDRLARGEALGVEGLAPGTYRVTASGNPDQHLAFSFTAPFSVRAGAATPVRLEMGPGVVVSGWVRDTAGQVVPSANVRFAEASGTFSASNGFLEVRVPRNGSLTAIVEGSGYAEAEVRLGAGDARLPAIRLVKREN